MNTVDLKLEEVYEAAVSVAEANKGSSEPMAAVEAFVAAAGADERVAIERRLCEWAEAEDELKRFTALAVIDRLGIVFAIPTLRSLAHHLESATSPSAPYEWAKVNRILGRLLEIDR